MIGYGLLSGANLGWLPAAMASAFDGMLWPVIVGVVVLLLLLLKWFSFQCAVE